MDYQKAIVSNMLGDPIILRRLSSFPIFLNEVVAVPDTVDTVEAWGFGNMYYMMESLLRTHPGLIRNKKILDVNCNIGSFSFVCARMGAKSVTGSDLDTNMLYLAKYTKRMLSFTNVSFITKAVDDLVLNGYDTILLLNSSLMVYSFHTPPSLDTSRAEAFYTKVNNMERVSIISVLSDNPAHMYKNKLYDEVAKSCLTGVVVKKVDRFMLYMKD